MTDTLDKKPAAPFTPSEFLRQQTGGLIARIGKWGVRLGLHPDAITLTGLACTLAAAWLAAQGQFLAAGLVLLLSSPLDALDGAVARAMNRRTRFGALLDSTTDRYADGFLFAALAYFFSTSSQPAGLILALLALIGSFQVSYVRARAEGLDIGSIRDGLFDRLVRLVILIAALITGLVLPGLVVLAVGTHLTALHRLYIGWKATRQDGT